MIPLNTRLIVLFTMLLAGLTCVSCLQTLTGKPSYDPATYGVSALLDTLLSAQSSASDAEAAARELQGRRLTQADGETLMRALDAQRHRRARIAILQTIAKHEMFFLYDDLTAYIPNAPDGETSVEAVTTAVSLAPDASAVRQLAEKMLLSGKYPEVRGRAARLIVNSFPEEAEPIFIKALENETSASAATYMCEFLAQKGSVAGASILETISNDIERKFETDSFLGVRATAETVRAAAVRGAERFR